MGVNLRNNPDNSASLIQDNGSHALAEVLRTDSQGGIKTTVFGTIPRVAGTVNLFTLPANAIIRGLRYYGAAVSNAATTATISVGKSGGTGAEYLAATDVKGATGAGVYMPTAGLLLHQSVGTAAQVVTGTYAETGGASSSGGPWTVEVDYSMN